MHSKKGFSFVELLVVIATGALLIAILMPALSNNRQIAKAVICQTNLKQLGFAANLYANDWETRVPRGGTSSQRSFMEQLLPYVGYHKKLQVDGNGNPVGTELAEEIKAFTCPSYPDHKAILGYIANGWALPHNNTSGASDYPTTSKEQKENPASGLKFPKLNQFIRLAETIYLADNEYFMPSGTAMRWPVKVIGYDPDSGMPEYRYCDIFRPSHLPCANDSDPPSSSETNRANGRRMARDRHKQGSNALYADWHVSHVKTEDMLKPSTTGYQNPEGNAAGIDMWRFWK